MDLLMILIMTVIVMAVAVILVTVVIILLSRGTLVDHDRFTTIRRRVIACIVLLGLVYTINEVIKEIF